MSFRLWRALMTLCALGIFAVSHAQAPVPFKTRNEALETDTRSVTLPSATDSMMTVATCSSCPIKSLRATPKSTYYLRDQQVTLTQLRDAVAANPGAFLTVTYSVKTGDLVSINASIDPASYAGR
jgi:hypothetical protein